VPRANAATATGLIAAVACAIGAHLCPPAFASARSDKGATRAYLRASFAYASGFYSEAKVDVAAVEAAASAIATSCPGALTYAPRDAAFSELSEEATGTLLFASAAPLRPIDLRFAAAIAHLSWSNRALTRLVRARLAEEREVAALVTPDMCTEIEAWKASSYAALPQSATAFIAQFRAIALSSSIGPFEEPREMVILRRLGRYEGRPERALSKHVETLEARLSKKVNAAITAGRAKIAAALGVSAL
jgi:hypothetical protein